LYEFGEGVDRDPRAAAEWRAKAVQGLKNAAEQGDMSAQFMLGACYSMAVAAVVVNAKDEQEAVKWYTKAAEQGYAYAQAELWFFYKDKDPREAVKWLTKAAERNLPQAQCELGRLYASGTGVDKNPQEAEKWFKLAAEQGYAPAEERLKEEKEQQ
ncbi:MAG: sel1 repeat family protein, partial [Planctomycetes bacterium]|nr:sel1 repeat family protein [Planctomycetota bacterium]